MFLEGFLRSVHQRRSLILCFCQLFLLFVFPGFPKEDLCIFLGFSSLPFKVFIFLASIGRMPGTLMLTLQGAFIYEKMYGLFVVILAVCLAIAFAAIRYREKIYQWVERLNGN